MSAVFISYRRNDSSGHTGRIYDYLCEEFGTDVIFRDIDTIEPGADFVEAVDKGIQGCSALIVVIGSEWLTAEDEMGRRLDDPNDFVRIEVASALKKNLRVIPVLVKGAVMPAAKDLPDDIALLARRHALELSDSRWDYDMGRLIEAIRPLLLEDTPEQAPDLEHDQTRQNDARDDNQPELTSIIPEEEITPTKPPVATKPPRHYLVFGVIGIALIAAVIFWLTQSPDETNITDDNTRPDVHL